MEARIKEIENEYAELCARLGDNSVKFQKAQKDILDKVDLLEKEHQTLSNALKKKDPKEADKKENGNDSQEENVNTEAVNG